MWGNAFGWKISALLVLVALAGALWLNAQMQISEPTSLSLDPRNLAELSPPMPARPILQQMQTGAAAIAYRQALADYPDAADACLAFAGNPVGKPPGPMQLLLDAAGKSSLNFFAKDPGQLINYQSDQASLDDLGELAGQMERAGLLLEQQKKLAAARRYFQAVYGLGLALYQERLDYEEYAKGMGLMDAATTGLADCQPEDSLRRQQFDQLAAEMVDYDAKHVLPIYKVLSSADQQVIARNAGDVFRFAGDTDHERMFRVEAILKLGRCRYDVARKADQLAAARYIRRFSQDPDPVIRAVARAAGDLTIEQYRMIH